MGHDSGRTAMWVCSALLGIMRHKGQITDAEIASLAGTMERHAADEAPEQRADMERAAQWLRHAIPAAND